MELNPNQRIYDVLQAIDRGVYRVPSIQRGYEWGSDRVTKLLDSIMSGYPIGAFMVWRPTPRDPRRHPHAALHRKVRGRAGLPLRTTTPREFGGVLHDVRHLGPDAQQLLAELLEELGDALDAGKVPSTELAHLAECAAQLVQTAHRREDTRLAAAKEGLEKAFIGVEMEFPKLADIGRKLAEALASLGI